MPGRVFSSILMRIHLPRYQVENRIVNIPTIALLLKVAAPLGQSGGGGDVCDECADAGHRVREPPSTNSDVLTADEALDKPTVENGVKEPEENQPTEEEPDGQKMPEKENCKLQQPVEEPEINAQSETVANNQRSDLVDDDVEINDGKGALEEGPSSVKVPGAKINNQTLLHQTDKLDQTKPKSDCSEVSLEKKAGLEKEQVMSSKLSVTSLASGESAASFSFSADSLGEIPDWIVFHQYLMRKS